jgi:hypothetical protein
MLQHTSFYLLLGEVLYQPDDFARISVTPDLEFGVNDLPVDADFVTASAGRNKSYALNLGFKIFE